jgi:multiple sugar transport system ATP-binding protein
VHVVFVATEGLTKIFDDGTVAVDDVSLRAEHGEFLVLLGPTGCGKSTILRLVAGLEEPTRGRVWIDGRVVNDVPARDRGISMVFQDYALYPHLTVEENIGFPVRVAHGADVRARVAEVAEMVGVAEVLHRFPGQLSGGQRQRAAMARALVRRPAVFLLDEPLSNLDAGLRAELRGEVAALVRRLGVTTIYVTHDQIEAMTMADRVAVLRRGRLEQLDRPEVVYGDPETLFVAAFIGTPRTSLLQGAVYAQPGGAVRIDLGAQVIEFEATDRRAAALRAHDTERITVAVHAEALAPEPPEAGGPTLRGRVRAVENLGHEALVHLDIGGLPTSMELSHLEIPDTGQHLAEVVGEDPSTDHRLRQRLSRMLPHQRQDEPPATARTPYGFYPVYDAELGDAPPTAGDVVVRVPAPRRPRPDEVLNLGVDLDRLLLFDRAGRRIRLD